jgi:outer membrane protein TolC
MIHARAALLPFLAVPVTVALAGCTVGPDYDPEASQQTVPDTFGDGIPDPALKPGTADLETWWTVFNDPQLTSLIERAAESNLDVRIALARVNEARARLGIAAAAGQPQVNAGGEAGVGDDPNDPNGSGTPRYSVGLDARIRTLQEQLTAAQQNLRDQQQIVEITKGRYEAGLSSRLDLVQSERILATTQAQIPPLRVELARSINTLGVLLGQFPRALADELEQAKPIPVPPEEVTIGVPANILRQRPDIRAAERRLAAQTARVGVATADLYPEFSLKGSIGIAGFGEDSYNPGGPSFFLGPSMRWNVFDGGRIRNQIKVEDFKLEQALLEYEATVLNGLEEVESAVVAFLEQRVIALAIARAAAAAREELQLGMDLYKQGLVGFQSVLDAERALFDLQNQEARARGDASIHLVRLYKALGGGWNPDTAKEPSSELPEEGEEKPS